MLGTLFKGLEACVVLLPEGPRETRSCHLRRQVRERETGVQNIHQTHPQVILPRRTAFNRRYYQCIISSSSLDGGGSNYWDHCI